MKKHLLTLILILAALTAVGFFPGPEATVQAIWADEPALTEPVSTASADSTSFTASPAVQIVVGLTGTLFGALTFLSLFSKEDSQYESTQPYRSDE